MKLNKIKKVGYYTDNLETRETIYEVIDNTDEQWIKEEPECQLLIDTWSYCETKDGSKIYECDGTLHEPRFADDIEVFEIKDTKYEVFGVSGEFLREVGKSYKERFEKLLDGDFGTLESLKLLLPKIENNTTAYEYLEKIIKDMQKELEELK